MRIQSMQTDKIPTDTDSLEYFDVTEDMKSVVQCIAVGDSERLMDELIIKSTQPHILEFTPKDASERFVNREAYHNWHNNGHQVHWLLNKEYDLAGIIWYRNKQIPIKIQSPTNPVETFAIRLYEGYVGHHLSVPFMKESLKIEVELKRRDGLKTEAIWLETKVENIAAVKSYLKLGYEEVYRDETKVVMIMSSDKVNEIADSIIL
jgi:hypothetical protein